jgi:hypothetical protein
MSITSVSQIGERPMTLSTQRWHKYRVKFVTGVRAGVADTLFHIFYREIKQSDESELFFGRLVIRIGTGGVIRDVDDPMNLGNRITQGDFDSLAQGHRRHAASRTTSA